jgi:hypothetical protein
MPAVTDEEWLHRIGGLLQAVFYAMRSENFDLNLADVKVKKDDKKDDKTDQRTSSADGKSKGKAKTTSDDNKSNKAKDHQRPYQDHQSLR